MAIKPAVAKVLSEQMVAEYYSAYLYLSLATAADRAGFSGAAHWLAVQAKEEAVHGTHIFEHILARDEAPIFADVKATTSKAKTLREIYQEVLAHEEHVTELINHLASVALKENDHTTYQFISWYVNEQTEEVDDVKKILDQINIIEKGGGGSIYTLDKDLAARVFVDPFPAAAN